jgi:CHAT domain-containing protein
LRRGITGDEIFLTACGLMASGSRTILLSRWRTGGQSAFDLAREFVQELPFTSAPNAWQRSVQLLQDKELRLDREPRIKAGNPEASIKADHPFFWAGYLLFDTGVVPKDGAK